jgi:outer membrane receptor protein involved in Fe transport
LGRQISVGQDQSAFFAEETIIDYQIKYNVTEKLNVTFSVNNLTDEANRSYFGDETKTGTIQYFGRNYFLGLNYTLD